MTTREPPGPDPDRCASWPPDKHCGKYDKAHGYDIWERKKGLQYVEALSGWLCRPCYRSYKSRQKEQVIVKPSKPAL